MSTSHSHQSSMVVRYKVGVFTLLSLALIACVTFLVNNRPYWWRPCQLVSINVEDATGLKMKSPVKSLGIEIGYLRSVMLSETHVSLGICITAPVEVLPSTRAYIRGEGFLGDKFVELKPVHYLDTKNSTSFFELIPSAHADLAAVPAVSTGDDGGVPITMGSPTPTSVTGMLPAAPAPVPRLPASVNDSDNKEVKSLPELLPEIRKAKPTVGHGKEIPMGKESQDIGQVVNRMNDLLSEISGVASNLKKGVDPEDLKKTMAQLNRTLENASRTLSPEGGLNQTAQRTLDKLEDASEQFRDLLTRINKGEGSLGMLLNDPSYAKEVKLALDNVNRLLNKFTSFRFVVDIGGSQIYQYNGGRGWFQVGIWPKKDRYYLLGIAMDPRGRISNVTTTTQAGGLTQVTQTNTVDQTGMLLTGMIGKVFWNRVDVSIGALYGDGAASVALYLGPNGKEDKIQIRNDIYFRNSASPLDDRISLFVQPFMNFYVKVGVESLHRYPNSDKFIYSIGGGIKFDDEDIKLLFSLR